MNKITQLISLSLLLTTIIGTKEVVASPGDSCQVAIPIPRGPHSCLTNVTLTKEREWFEFIPTSSSVKIVIANTHHNRGHIHDISLYEGLCPDITPIANMGLNGVQDTLHDSIILTVNDLIPGIPHYILAMRGHMSCQGCTTGSSIFNICVDEMRAPVRHVRNGIVYLDGKPAYKANQIAIKFSPANLRMNNVNDTSIKQGLFPVFVDTASIVKYADSIFHFNPRPLFACTLKKVFPKMTSHDSVEINNLMEPVNVPGFWETFRLIFPKSFSIPLNEVQIARAANIINGVFWAEPCYVNDQTFFVPNDPIFGLQTDLSSPSAGIDVENAWNITTGSPGVTIGIFDSGIDWTDDDFGFQPGGGTGFDYFNNVASNKSIPLDDSEGHGTFCASLAAAGTNDNNFIAGVAGGNNSLGCKLVDSKILQNDANFCDNLTIEYAIKEGQRTYGENVMNFSWGSPTYQEPIEEGLEFVAEAGVTAVAASGNYPSGSNTLTTPLYPAAFASEYLAISVGASGTDGAWENPSNDAVGDGDYSSQENAVDVIAPGSSSMVAGDLPGNISTNGPGTSGSAPQVAGLAGLMLSYYGKSLSIEDVTNIMKISAVSENGGTVNNPSPASGAGRIDCDNALTHLQSPYKIYHFDSHITSNTVTTTKIASGVPCDVPSNYNNGISMVSQGSWNTDIYKVVFTFNYSLSPGDVPIFSWPRYSSTIGWNSTANPINLTNWCQIDNITATSAQVETYVFDIFSPNDPYAPCHLTQAKVAFTVYTIASLAGVQNISDSTFNANVFPNPASTSTYISYSLSNSADVSIDIFDDIGKSVKSLYYSTQSAGSHKQMISVANLSQGVYICRITAGNISEVKKLVVIK